MQPQDTMFDIPYGYCQCGCGRKTTIAAFDDRRNGIRQKEPRRFIKGHHRRIPTAAPGPNPSGLCLCGCGHPAPIAKRNNAREGWIRGKPKKFIKGHNHKVGEPSNALRRATVERTKRKWLTAEERFWQRVNQDGPIHPGLGTACWLWTEGFNYFGYGRFSVGRQSIGAHRYSYELHIGPIPDGLYVCHHCDNPACVNPAHLFVGTAADNTADSVAKGRHYDGNHFVGETNPSAKLTADDVLAIRDLATRRAMFQRDIATKFGVSQALIEKIIARKVWSHI